MEGKFGVPVREYLTACNCVTVRKGTVVLS